MKKTKLLFVTPLLLISLSLLPSVYANDGLLPFRCEASGWGSIKWENGDTHCGRATFQLERWDESGVMHILIIIDETPFYWAWRPFDEFVWKGNERAGVLKYDAPDWVEDLGWFTNVYIYYARGWRGNYYGFVKVSASIWDEEVFFVGSLTDLVFY